MLDGNVLDHWDYRFARHRVSHNSAGCPYRAQLVHIPQLESICGSLRCSKVNVLNQNSRFRLVLRSFSNFFSLMLGSWLFFFPESPKFLIECGETEEALEILRDMYEENTGNLRSEYPVIL